MGINVRSCVVELNGQVVVVWVAGRRDGQETVGSTSDTCLELNADFGILTVSLSEFIRSGPKELCLKQQQRNIQKKRQLQLVEYVLSCRGLYPFTHVGRPSSGLYL